MESYSYKNEDSNQKVVAGSTSISNLKAAEQIIAE
jgi:hypothetical protein